MRILDARNGRVVADDAEVARSLIARAVGLIGRPGLDPGRALIIPACRQVHTFFMRFPIDVIFAGRDGEIIKAIEKLPPWRTTGYYRRAVSTIELPAGTISSCDLHVGDRLTIEDTSR
jgi:hypothetical protein